MWLLSWDFLWLLDTRDLAIDMWYIILHRKSYTNCSKLWKTTGIISICLANIWCAWSDRTGCVDAIIKNPYEINQHPLPWQWKRHTQFIYTWRSVYQQNDHQHVTADELTAYQWWEQLSYGRMYSRYNNTNGKIHSSYNWIWISSLIIVEEKWPSSFRIFRE